MLLPQMKQKKFRVKFADSGGKSSSHQLRDCMTYLELYIKVEEHGSDNNSQNSNGSNFSRNQSFSQSQETQKVPEILADPDLSQRLGGSQETRQRTNVSQDVLSQSSQQDRYLNSSTDFSSLNPLIHSTAKQTPSFRREPSFKKTRFSPEFLEENSRDFSQPTPSFPKSPTKSNDRRLLEPIKVVQTEERHSSAKPNSFRREPSFKRSRVDSPEFLENSQDFSQPIPVPKSPTKTNDRQTFSQSSTSYPKSPTQSNDSRPFSPIVEPVKVVETEEKATQTEKFEITAEFIEKTVKEAISDPQFGDLCRTVENILGKMYSK